MSQVSLGRPEFVPGTPPGHPDRQIPLRDFSLSVFSLSKEGNVDQMSENVEKMPEKYQKIVQRSCKNNFRTSFAQFLPIWSMLLFGLATLVSLSNARPLQP